MSFPSYPSSTHIERKSKVKRENQKIHNQNMSFYIAYYDLLLAENLKG